jgi:hypothetical protein
MPYNTLRTDATQMVPEARGLTLSTFANVLFIGQAASVWCPGRHRPDRLSARVHCRRRGAARGGRRFATARQPPGGQLSAVGTRALRQGTY